MILVMDFLLAIEKMNPHKFLVIITDLKQIDIYKKARITNFLFPLEGFCVGYPNAFSLDEIEEGYLYINRILDKDSYEKLKDVLKNIPSKIKGLVFEDLGVITLSKELNLKQELIVYQTHFNTNHETINELLCDVDSVVISSDITKEEILEILAKEKKPLVYFLYGMTPAMYSRRTLLTNFESEFHLEENKQLKLEEQVTKKQFISVENEYGTVLYYNKFLNGVISLPDEKIEYYLINSLFLKESEIKELLKDFLSNSKKEKNTETRGFLDTKTIYRIKEDEDNA